MPLGGLTVCPIRFGPSTSDKTQRSRMQQARGTQDDNLTVYIGLVLGMAHGDCHRITLRCIQSRVSSTHGVHIYRQFADVNGSATNRWASWEV